MPRSSIDAATVTKIKTLLWNGATCESLAPQFDMSVSAIRGILAGTRWKHIPWPSDGKKVQLVGGIPEWRHAQIYEARKAARRESYKTVAAKLKQS